MHDPANDRSGHSTDPSSGRRSGMLTWLAIGISIYILSIGPAVKLHNTCPAARPVLEVLYSPIRIACGQGSKDVAFVIRMRRPTLTIMLALGNVLLLAVVFWQAQLLRLHRNNAPLPAPPPGLQSEKSGQFSSSSSSGPLVGQNAEADFRSGGDALRATLNAGTGHLPPETNVPTMDWRQIESSDYRKYVQNLRGMGCPPQTVRDIVTTDLVQAFAGKRAEVMAARYRNFEFWKSDEEEASARRAAEQQQRAVNEEMRGALRELLGTELEAPATTAAWKLAELEQQLAFLPEHKQAKTLATLRSEPGLYEEVRGLSEGRRTPEDPGERQRTIEAYDKQRAELASLLTPEEFEKVDMTASWTGDNLRRAMEHFQPTEEEFRVIFRAWRAHDENLAHLYAGGQPDPGNAQVYAKIRESLTPERYEQYVSTWWK